MDNEAARIRNSIKSDHHSKSAYVGRVTQTEKVAIFTEDGTPVETEITFFISWDSIDQLLTLIRERAAV